MRVLGAWSGHDASWCTVESDGTISHHAELERTTREKEVSADSLAAAETEIDASSFDAIATCHAASNVTARPSWRKHAGKRELHVVSHHLAHAADARWSSRFEECAVVVVDGGGFVDDAGTTVATSLWHAAPLGPPALVNDALERDFNLGGLWTRATRYVFGLESGWPQGHQAGSVMAMAALGDPARFRERFLEALGSKRREALRAPAGHAKGMSASDPRRPKHPYWRDLEELASSDQQSRFDLAAGLQRVTEEAMLSLVDKAAALSKRVCLTGGCALNCAFAGKLLTLRPDLEVYVPAVPYDAGLSRGAALQWLHGKMGVAWEPKSSWGVPYLGRQYSRSEVDEALAARASEIAVSPADDHLLVEALARGDVIAVFRGRAESGRRALGNRSIIADPRSASARDRVNARVKHRQSFRPFAPSVPRARVRDWFAVDVDSPFMSFAVPVRFERASQIPAVVHVDGTARLQTVEPLESPWYHALLLLWEAKSGVPILLNTSYNDREPIVETPSDALACFLKTDLDAMWLPEYGLRVTKRCL